MRGQPSSAALVGRGAELDALTRAYAAAASGTGTTVLVAGEAGVGKSRLVDELAAHARGRGARVLVGQCLDLEEGGLPYAPIADVLRTLDRELGPDEGAATLAPLRALLGRPAAPTTADGAAPPAGGTVARGSRASGSPAEGADDDGAPRAGGGRAAGSLGQARLFELLLTVVERLVGTRPLVLVLEDLHWADTSTLDLVALVASHTRTMPVLTVGTYRSDDVPPGHRLRTLAGELARRGADRLEVDRLGPGDVAEMLAALLPRPPSAEVVASVVERSDGNPLFVEELAGALADDPGAAMPPQLRDAVIARVERLPPDAAAVLRACAVGGREVEHELLAEAVGAGAGTDALDRALRPCVDRRLLLVDQQRSSYRFRHALLHEAVLGEVLPGERHRLHRAYAGALARRQAGDGTGDGSWARLAHHWEAAGDHDAALAAAVRAGRAAEAAFAVPEAHRYLEWSVRLWDRAGDPVAAAGCDRADLLARAADAASRGSAVARALTLVDEALASPGVAGDPVRTGLLHERRGWYLQRSGRADDALAAYQRAVALVPPVPPSPARARVVQARAHALVRAGRIDEARTRADEALALARAADDRVDEGQALHVQGLVLASEGRTDEALASLHEAGQIAAGLGDLAEVAGAYVHLWRTLVEAGRAAELVDLLAVVGAGTGGAGDPAPTLMGVIGAAALHELGRWDEADRLLGSAAAAADAGGLTAVARTLVSGAVAVDRGDLDRARDELETARAWCHQVGDGRLNGLLHRALAELAVWQDRHDDARREVAAGLDLLAHTGDPELAARIAAVGVRAEAERVARTRRATGEAGRTVAEAETVARGLVARLEDLAGTAVARRAPPRSEAAAALATGRGELARASRSADPDAWAAAVAAWDAVGFPHPAAYARMRLAEARLASRDADAATSPLLRAWDTTRRLGARPLATAIAHVARRARVALPQAGAAPADGAAATGSPGSTAGPGGDLTPREREVLALVAEGWTNRQIGEQLFISQKTASVHVSRVLAKLGAATRGEAAALARRAGLLDDTAPG